jgi:hypothetical protein
MRTLEKSLKVFVFQVMHLCYTGDLVVEEENSEVRRELEPARCEYVAILMQALPRYWPYKLQV